MPAYHYNPPPNWPPPPPGWAPGPGWQPDPAWGPPPQGWQLWVEPPDARPPRSRAALAGAAALVTLIAVLAVVTLVALVSPDQEPVVTTPAVGTPDRPSPTPTATPTSSTPTVTPTPTPAPTPDVPPGVPAGAQVARVVDVADGDTLTIAAAATGAVLSTSDPVRVRLLQIDTPEQGEPLSDEATAGLVALAGPGTTVWALRDQDPRDQYGRELLYLWTGDGTFVNEEMVLSGLATAVLYEPNDRYIDQMRAAQDRARSAGLGLWAPPPPPPPEPAADPEPAPRTAPQPLVQAPQGGGHCDPSYPGVCIPPHPPDLDCDEIEYGRFEVRQPDPHGFDRDKDGVGCESG